jgi:hypothetical protein
MLASKFSTIFPLISNVLLMKRAQFNVALKKYLNTQSLYSVDELLLSKNDTLSSQGFI